jgi:hypothetical protein
VAFALRTVLKGRTRGDGQSKSFIKFSDKVCRLIERSEVRRARPIKALDRLSRARSSSHHARERNRTQR